MMQERIGEPCTCERQVRNVRQGVQAVVNVEHPELKYLHVTCQSNMLSRAHLSGLFPVNSNYSNILASYQFATDAPKRIILRHHRFSTKCAADKGIGQTCARRTDHFWIITASKSFTATLLIDLEGSLAGSTTKTEASTDGR
ncbi:hypothetical protein AV530_003800 [Patagioenas fasciata monilis]|uniref:Uncharacterized protein n=1 Tax=Patagioenas fasciata monilis TaxID=372326 RepID=A0A1V4KYR4_PATFA|nr:hypothetical protein AV530_003800 [Patagioenas fasciata monilis]